MRATIISGVLLAGFVLTPAQANSEQSSREFKDCDTCPTMVTIEPGSFKMGEKVKDELRHGMPESQTGRATPVHKVKFKKSFAIAKYPVTVAQFATFVAETGYQPARECYTQYKNDGHFIYESARGFTWRYPGFNQDENHPVVCVNAYDGEAYAAWLSEKTGHTYSLPNEAQYEYSARAGTKTAFFWADARSEEACLYSNQPDLDQAIALGDVPTGPKYRFQCHDGYAFTSPVDAYKPNPWGLHDMFGNIWEWTADCWNDSYDGAPKDGSTWTEGDCDARSSRGGSYGNAAFSTYAGIRAPRHASFVGHSWGFRVVRTD